MQVVADTFIGVFILLAIIGAFAWFQLPRQERQKESFLSYIIRELSTPDVLKVALFFTLAIFAGVVGIGIHNLFF